MGSAYCDPVAAGSDGADAFVVDLGESAWVEGERDVLGLAGCEMYAGEAVEGVVGRDVGVRRSEVEFGDFFAGALAGVFDVGLYGEAVAGVEGVGGEL